ncbi:MAG: PepSY-like domain-containing protein [Bacteroidetes bacterium]|nr:PepSY-like domain-containing protein [Bacteroidota bacterium]
MKRAMFLLLVTAVMVIGGCSKKDQTSTTSPTSQTTLLPARATAYVETNYPDATIDYILVLANSGAKFVVALNTAEELAFSGDGNYLGDGRNYHQGNHPGDTIPGDSLHGDTIHCWHHHGHHGGGHGIPPDSLSPVIKDYIAANFAGYTILNADYDSLCVNGLVKEVMIGKRDSVPPVKLIFSATDSYLLQASRFRYSDVPQAVKEYITANYSSYEVCNAAEKYILADNSVQYMVYLRLDRSHLRVRLLADGTLVCSQ